MNTNKRSLQLAAVGLTLASALAGIAACSSDDNANPSPPDDAGNLVDQTASSSGSGSSSGSSSGSGSGSSSGSTDSGSSSGSVDSGCVADATPNCSSCASSSADPYNSCSAFTVNCVPFDNSVLPSPYPTF